MRRFLHVWVLWVGAIAVAGGFAYFGAKLGLRQDKPASVTAAHLRDARKVESFATELHALLDSIGPPGTANAPHLAGLRPKVREKHQQILRARISGGAYSALLTTVDRLAAYVASPQNTALYDATRSAQRVLEDRLHAELTLLEEETARQRNR